MNRREFAAAGVSLSALLAGCTDTEDDGSDETDGPESTGDDAVDEDGSASDADDSSDENGPDAESDTEDGPDAESDDEDEPESTESGEANESDEDVDRDDEIHEDESINGEVSLSAAAERHLAVERHTFTWGDEPPHEFCEVHLMLANASGAEVTATVTARLYDAEGNELSSTTEAGADGPEPGADDAVYSFELNNCADAAAYELELDDVEADDEGGEPVERHLFRVVVQDEFGEPIDHATVTLEERGLGGWGETETVDDHGVAEFEFQSGEYVLVVAAEEYPTLEEGVELTGNTEYTATLRADD
ncbi:carboxypeptidase-like regulatory domain-containing protein [Natronococcus occultus]|nr:carboxypeptidase-like regulatory domain-containing protein [Natronococcus occultus]